jgi:hypothetical protein
MTISDRSSKGQSPEEPLRRFRTVAEVATELTPEEAARHEAAYRRGCDQTAFLAVDLVDRAPTLQEARKVLRRLKALTFKYRFKLKNKGRLYLLDCIRTDLQKGRTR